MSSEGLSRRGLLTGGAAIALAAAVPMAATMGPERAEAQTASAANVTPISYTDNARRAAHSWSTEHPTGAAVAVYLGNSGDLSPTLIEQSIRRGFARDNVTNVAFFYEQNDMPRTGFSLHENGNGYGPYQAPELRDAIAVVAGQVNLVRQHPELASR